jgi:hypothetical protein
MEGCLGEGRCTKIYRQQRRFIAAQYVLIWHDKSILSFEKQQNQQKPQGFDHANGVAHE